jgi:hypothetical protein
VNSLLSQEIWEFTSSGKSRSRSWPRQEEQMPMFEKSEREIGVALQDEREPAVPLSAHYHTKNIKWHKTRTGLN